MRSSMSISMVLSLAVFWPTALMAGHYTDAEKEIIIQKMQAIRSGVAPAVYSLSTGQIDKCGTKFAIALDDIKDDIDPALAKTLLQRPVRQTYIDTEHFRIHYDTIGVEAPPLADNILLPGVPDYVDSVALVFEYVWNYELDSLGYGQTLEDIIGFHGPKQDGGEGGSDAYDIYLSNIGSHGYYGITETECGEFHCASCIEVENDYAEPVFISFGYGGRPMEALKVTAAHEFFHAIHYSLDRHEAGDNTRFWWQEASAVWMENEVFDDINDYLFSISNFFKYPWLSLETYTVNSGDIGYMHPYASCVWPMFLGQKYDKDVIRQIWQGCGEVDGYNVLPATAAALGNFGTTFDDAFQEFTVWNYFTSYRADTLNKYSEANLWSDTMRTIYYTTSFPLDDTLEEAIAGSDTPQPLSANYFVINRTSSVTGGLTIWFNGDQDLSGNDEWRANVLGWDPAQNSVVQLYVNSSTGSGSGVFRGWQHYANIVIIPAIYGSTYDNLSHGYSVKALYDQYLNDDSPTLCELESLYKIKSGDCLNLQLCASDPNGDSVTFSSSPPPASLTGLTITPINDSSATLTYCPGYELIDSTLSVTIYARDSDNNYDARRIDFEIVFFPVSETQSVSVVGYPNPFYYATDQSISLRYFLPDSVDADNAGLFVFNVAGELVFKKEFTDIDWLAPGEAVFSWNARNNSNRELAAGIYIIKIRAGDRSAGGKIAIIR